MERLNNPFVIYGYKGAEYFCDRQKETGSIMRVLHNERNVALMIEREFVYKYNGKYIIYRILLINSVNLLVYIKYFSIFAPNL